MSEKKRNINYFMFIISVVNKKSKNDAVSSRSNQFYLSGPLPRTVSKSTGSIRQGYY